MKFWEKNTNPYFPFKAHKLYGVNVYFIYLILKIDQNGLIIF